MEANHLAIDSDIIFIVGGGPSVKGYDLTSLRKHGFVLGVNDSFLHTPCDAVFSMDGRWMHHRADVLKAHGIKCYFSEKHFNKWIGVANTWPQVSLLKVDHRQIGMSESWYLWANNSGLGALGVAYMSRPKAIFLYGFDLTKNRQGDEHWYGDYEWRQTRRSNQSFVRWMDDHTVAAQQLKDAGIKVYNVSQISEIQVYKRIFHAKIHDYIAEIRRAEPPTP